MDGWNEQKPLLFRLTSKVAIWVLGQDMGRSSASRYVHTLGSLVKELDVIHLFFCSRMVGCTNGDGISIVGHGNTGSVVATSLIFTVLILLGHVRVRIPTAQGKVENNHLSDSIVSPGSTDHHGFTIFGHVHVVSKPFANFISTDETLLTPSLSDIGLTTLLEGSCIELKGVDCSFIVKGGSHSNHGSILITGHGIAKFSSWNFSFPVRREFVGTIGGIQNAIDIHNTKTVLVFRITDSNCGTIKAHDHVITPSIG
mmetsp:Transcript_3140/g.7369  ORF Transcript_3140/g.7369 Transcript_3140/m.7369 type:complete len:256 (+) Transcript_3140:60-827(+)